MLKNNIITEDYVSYETAKLLKDKGFNEYCKNVYHVGSVCSVAFLGYHNNERYGEVIDEKQNSDFGKYDNAISAPTIQMVMKWLREVHKLHIWIAHKLKQNKGLPWYYEIHNIETGTVAKIGDVVCGSYEVACETAIKYCLEKLI